MTDTKRVIQTGTFDVRNYGDLLFPLIAQYRLARDGIKILPASPTGADTGWADAMASRPMEQVLRESEGVDAFLIGGGNIVHAEALDVREYDKGSLKARAYLELWFGATLAAILRDVPIIWNAPGVKSRMTDDLRAAGAIGAVRLADYLSVRDEPSALNLRAGFGPEIVVPDTAVDISRMWPRHSLEPHFKTLLERKNAPSGAKYLAVHLKERSLSDEFDLAVTELDKLSEATGLVPILIAIGPCHGDDALARRIAGQLKGLHVVLDDPLGLREIAAAIAHSSFYLGNSLHGYITSQAYDVPGIVVAKPLLAKFEGFLAQIDRKQDLARSWNRAFAMMQNRAGEERSRRIPESAFEKLDTHWDKVRAAILTPALKLGARARFLKTYLAYSTNVRGPDWLFEALLPRAP